MQSKIIASRHVADGVAVLKMSPAVTSANAAG